MSSSSISSLVPSTPSSTLFPYTTLFRSKLQPQLATTEQQWHEQKARSTALSERMQALEDIQQQWASPAQLQQWLQEQQLDTVPRLWPLLRVQEDWEVALEAVLREQIGAFLLDDELARSEEHTSELQSRGQLV